MFTLMLSSVFRVLIAFKFNFITLIPAHAILYSHCQSQFLNIFCHSQLRKEMALKKLNADALVRKKNQLDAEDDDDDDLPPPEP